MKGNCQVGATQTHGKVTCLLYLDPLARIGDDPGEPGELWSSTSPALWRGSGRSCSGGNFWRRTD
eukprot:9691445-Prorocentrum_lima.AAC.1